MFEGHSTGSRMRDDEPGEVLYAHPAGLVLAVASGTDTPKITITGHNGLCGQALL